MDRWIDGLQDCKIATITIIECTVYYVPIFHKIIYVTADAITHISMDGTETDASTTPSTTPRTE